MIVKQLPEKIRLRMVEIQTVARELARERGKQISTIADAYVAVGLFNKELEKLSKEYEARTRSAYKSFGLFGDIQASVAGVDAKTGQVLIREEGEEELTYEELKARYDEALAKAKEDQGTSEEVLSDDDRRASVWAHRNPVGVSDDVPVLQEAN